MPPTYRDALALYQQRNFQDAAKICVELAYRGEADAESQNLLGVIRLEGGDAEGAVAAFVDGLKRNPSDAMMLNNLGNALRKLGNLAQAEASYRQALQVNSNLLPPWLGLCGVFLDGNQPANARLLIDQLLPLVPNNPDLLFNEALVLIAEGREADAIAVLERIIQLEPRMVVALIKFGDLLARSRVTARAAAIYQQALQLQPADGQALNGFVEAMVVLDRAADALPLVDRATQFAPADHKIQFLAGIAADLAQQPDRAVKAFDQALALRPGDAELRVICGEHAFKMGRWRDAVRLYEQALAIDPRQVKARLLLCAHQLPVAYRAEAEIDECRAAFVERLGDLEAWFATADPAQRARAAELLPEALPFLLAAQGRGERDLLGQFGALVVRIMSDFQPPITTPSRQDGPIRLGIVSGFFRQHAVWKIPMQGFVTGLDPARVRLFCYSTGTESDTETAIARRHAARFVEGPRSREQWIAEIASDRLDALLYPDYYMDPTTAMLAPLRLVPVQIALGCHPITTGLPTMDYHLSADAMEPPDARDHYTETLVLLPNLANCYQFPAIAHWSVSRAEIGVPDDAVMYWCGQSLHKILPRDDQLFGGIAQAVPNAFFVFIEQAPGHAANDILRERLDAVLGAGSEGQRYILLPKMPIARFQAITSLADVFLDATAWSGNNTAMESLTAGLPIVTLPGETMRARHVFAILQMMGVTETIARSRQDYIDIAVRLGLDAAWRAEISGKMAGNRNKVLNDLSCVRALEDFLEKICR